MGGKASGTPRQRLEAARLEPLFNLAVLLIRLAIGIVLLGLAVAVLSHALATLPKNLQRGIPIAIGALLDAILLLLVLIEVLRVTLAYDATRTSLVHPFLTVATITLVRLILSASIELSSAEERSRGDFLRSIAALVTGGMILLVVAIALWLAGRHADA